jgi:hypothetical protein
VGCFKGARLFRGLSIVPSLPDSPHSLPTRHCRAGLQAMPSLRDWYSLIPLKGATIHGAVADGLSTFHPYVLIALPFTR